MRRMLILLLVFMLPHLYADVSPYPEGWHWYNVPAVPGSQETPSIKNLTPLQQLKIIQQGMDEAKARATLYPTEANVTAYYEMQAFALDQSSAFAAMTPKMLLDHPALNYQITHPTEQAIVHEVNGQKTTDEVSAVKALAATNGILFFYRGKQLIDQQMAQNVKNFATAYNIAILPVSVDGTILPVMTNSQVDHGEAAAMGIQYFPAVVLFNDETHTIQPVAYGYLAQDELLQQFLLVYTHFKAEF